MSRYWKLVLLFGCTYLMSYVTRINFATIVSEMVADTGFTKTLLSLSLTGSAVCYGLGQLISGVCGDHISPKKLVFFGLVVSSVMNALLPLCGDPYLMLPVWCINGFAQAFMWPPLVKIMTELFQGQAYVRAVLVVSWGSSLGTILLYLLSPLVIMFLGWKAVFFLSAALGLAMAMIWHFGCVDTSHMVQKTAIIRQEQKKLAFLSPVIVGIMVAIGLHGMLRDGVTTWMPSFIGETYGLSSEISILTGVLLPVFSILCFSLSSRLYGRWFRNPLSCAACFFAVAMAAAAVLVGSRYAALSVLSAALLTGCMHGVNMMLISVIPSFYKSTGHVSTVSGILNCCAYLGSALSTYGVAAVTDSFGWNVTIYLWLGTAVIGCAICLLCIKPWERRMMV